MATSSTASLHRLSSWFASVAGGRLIDEQMPYVADGARRFHGDTLLWVGCHTPLLDTVRGCMIRNLLLLELPQVCTCPPGVTDIARFQAIPHEIPLANNTLDAMVLHHALETATDPRTAIRECSRVLAEGGRLLICGFNPSSAWGLRRAYSRMFDDSFSDLRFVNPRRLVDWLTVLGFETEAVKYIAYGLPFNTKRADAKLWRGVRATFGRHQLPLGGAYVLSAVKQALAVRPDWRSEAVRGGKLAPVAYPKLSAWNPD